MKNGRATIITQGVVTLPNSKPFVPGKYYYSNSRGELIEGEWIGQRGENAGCVYLEDSELVVSAANRIGFAISTDQLMIIPKQIHSIV